MAQSLKHFRKIAVANRGEVAVRILRACEEMGIRAVLLHSEADTGSRAWRVAPERVCIGAAPSNESYLSIEKNILGACKAGADALHPGFGFLSENASFADSCADAGMTFIGPSPDSIRKMGDKISARERMMKLGLPVIPGYQGDRQDLAHLKKEAMRIGTPLIIKAAAGGGGRGMKVVRDLSEFDEQVASAKREALGAFGSETVFLEKYIQGAKHIEFQVFGDTHGNVVHLCERECSVQRRHQKVIEESLSPSLSPELRAKMGAAAVKAAKNANYFGAGTVEFLLEGDSFYFLEMNTRLQVEHPVTELVMGLDLVKAQIRIAMGEKLSWPLNEPVPHATAAAAAVPLPHVLVPRGHAIECRLYAEDAYQNGIPSTGRLGLVYFPEGPGRRFDSGVESGDIVTSYYDSMIAKIIVWDETRADAIKKMLRVLSDTVIFGVKTNIPYLKAILTHPEFQSGRMNIQFISQFFPDGITAPQPDQELLEVQETLYRAVAGPSAGTDPRGSGVEPVVSPWTGTWSNV